MATNVKLSELTATTTLSSGDLFGLSQDQGSGSYESRNITYDNFLNELEIDIAASPIAHNKQVEEKSSAYSIVSGDANKTFIIGNTNVVFTIPASTGLNVGTCISFAKYGTGTLTVSVSSTLDYIADSSGGGTIYNDSATETYATLSIQLIKAYRWVVMGAHGTWTTT